MCAQLRIPAASRGEKHNVRRGYPSGRVLAPATESGVHLSERNTRLTICNLLHSWTPTAALHFVSRLNLKRFFQVERQNFGISAGLDSILDHFKQVESRLGASAVY